MVSKETNQKTIIVNYIFLILVWSLKNKGQHSISSVFVCFVGLFQGALFGGLAVSLGKLYKLIKIIWYSGDELD